MAENIASIDGTKDGDIAKAHAAQAAEDNDTHGTTTQTQDHDELPPEVFNEKTIKFVQKKYDELKAVKTKRKEMAAKKAEITASVVDKGFDRDGFKLWEKFDGWDEDKRHMVMLTFRYFCKINNVPLTDDLFAATVDEQLGRHQAGKQH